MSMRAVVTGAASGMGAATARLLSERGFEVTAVDRDADGLAALVEEGAAARAILVDLTDGGAVQDALGGVVTDSLVNVAGVGPDAGDPTLIWTVNLLAPLRLIRDVRVEAGGSIVNVASITGELAPPAHADLLDDPLRDGFLEAATEEVGDATMAYTYSKWALLRETERLALRMAPHVRVNAVSPGIIETPMGNRSMKFDWTRKAADRIPSGRLGRADEVADAIEFLVSGRASYITGARLVVDGGYVASRRRSAVEVG